MSKNLIALIGGVIFGLGLCISQMSNPYKIMAFLDITGAWDPSLLLVMFSALVILSIGYRLALKRGRPVLDQQFYLPSNSTIDKKLIIGGSLFGIGWGLIGYCPGPIVTSLGFLSFDILLVFIGMLAGMLSWGLVSGN